MKGPTFPLPEFTPLQNKILKCSYEGRELKPGCTFEVEARFHQGSVGIRLHSRMDDQDGAHGLTIVFDELIAPGAFANLVIPVPWLFRQDFNPSSALCRYVETYLSQSRIEVSDMDQEIDGKKAVQLALIHALYKSCVPIPVTELEKYFKPKPDDPPPPLPPDVP
ncbi:MAG: hypothetical protein WC750_01575 [Patescibacteria group bacterium]